MAQGKYFVNPHLANLFQKREGNGPAGLAYLPEISDTSAIPEGIDYFYYTGEDHDQFVNGCIYKATRTQETQQVWEIITPAVTEPRHYDIAAGATYIDVLADGYNVPLGRYYQADVVNANYNDVVYNGSDGYQYKSSYDSILQIGDVIFGGDMPHKITAKSGIRFTIEGGVVCTLNGGNSSPNGNLYVSAEGNSGYYSLTRDRAGFGQLREYQGEKYLYCDGLIMLPNTVTKGTTAEALSLDVDFVITPAVWGWVEHEVTTTTWSQHDAQPRAVAKVESTDGTKFILVENSGTTIEGDVIAKNNVTVKGNLYVEGTEVVTDVETVQSEDDFIKLRFGNQSALGEGQSGLQVLNFDGNGATMFLVVGGDGILRLGLGNELEPVTTRDEAAAMVDGAVTVWNAQAQKIKTGPAAADLVTSEEIKTLKALSQAAYDALTTKDVTTGYFII